MKPAQQNEIKNIDNQTVRNMIHPTVKPLTTCLAAVALLTACQQAPQRPEPYSWEADLRHRIALDFGRSEAEVKAYIAQYLPDASAADLRRWEEQKALEYAVIDGEKRYFNNAAPNLFRIDSACREAKRAKEGGSALSGSERVNQYHLPEVIAQVRRTGRSFVEPKQFRVTYTLTVAPDAVPEGQMVRCWLPYPQATVGRQTDVRLIRTSEKVYSRAPVESLHATLYMEKPAVKGKPTVFSECFELTASAEWHDLSPEMVQPYDTTTQLYRTYTAERERHIRFTPELRQLAARLTDGVDNPLLKARRIFKWINDNYPWASAREYSTIDNIPMYVLENGHGDCGQVTLLFLTLCRIVGIPAHFQSGFMLHPGACGLHDWGEIYFEGVGWVPVDQSFGIPSFASSEAERWFFLGGIDSYRLVVNNDFGQPLIPPKRYPRSETVDFQRGEVEWDGGNLYFDQWDYDLRVEPEPDVTTLLWSETGVR